MNAIAKFLIASMFGLAIASPTLQAQVIDDQPLFNEDSILTMKIEAPLSTLFGKERETGEAVDATLTVSAPGYESETFDIKLETRGKTRRDSKVCKFPPLTVDLKKKEVKNSLFAKQNKLKLVTHCQNKRASYDTYYIQEHLIYKTYNLLTEESFRVRLALIDYVDTEGRNSVSGKYGFFIEDADRVAKRLGRERRDVERVPSASYSASAASRVALFQYFIGNLDWAMLGGPEGESCCHNLKPMFAANGEAIPVPYDFDYSGLINAKYAVPPATLRVKNVRTRMYRGFCSHNSALAGNVKAFQDNKSKIYALVQTSELLTDRTKNNMIKYYDDFYETIDDPKKTDRYLVDQCR